MILSLEDNHAGERVRKYSRLLPRPARTTAGADIIAVKPYKEGTL